MYIDILSKEITNLEIISFVISSIVLLITVLWISGFKRQFFSRFKNPAVYHPAEMTIVWIFSVAMFTVISIKYMTISGNDIKIMNVVLIIIIVKSFYTIVKSLSNKN
jgi:hypothetical protein